MTVKAVKSSKGKAYNGDYEVKVVYPQSWNFSGSIYAAGDSIALGAGSHGYSYNEIFSVKHNLNLNKNAISGSTFSCDPNVSSSKIPESIKQNLTKKYDYIFLEGGVNDYAKNCKLGKIVNDSNYTAVFDKNTTCGALQSTLQYIRKNYPSTKIYFISIHNVKNFATFKNELGLTYVDYLDKIEEICKMYNVTIVDCFGKSGFNTSNVDLSRGYTTHSYELCPNGDGLHPTEAGYLKYYVHIIEECFNN